MRALVFNSVGEPLAIETRPDPEPGEGELVIRVSRCGVCGTDLHSTSGHGMTLPGGSQFGHEYGGEVVAVGKGADDWREGDRLSALPVVGCGHCDGCATGLDILCTNQWQGYGAGLAEYAKVSMRGATRLPQTMSLADSALIEPLAVGCRAVRLANPGSAAKVVIIGPGPIGLSVLFWLRQRGVENVVLLASSGRRRELAAAMGATQFVVDGDHAKDAIYGILGGAPDVVFEAAGVTGVFQRAVDLVKPQGLVMGLGFCMQPDPIVPAMNLMKDVTMRWSVIYTREDFATCANALTMHGDLARAMVTDTVGMDAAPAAFEELRRGSGGGGKLLIDPWS